MGESWRKFTHSGLKWHKNRNLGILIWASWLLDIWASGHLGFWVSGRTSIQDHPVQEIKVSATEISRVADATTRNLDDDTDVFPTTSKPPVTGMEVSLSNIHISIYINVQKNEKK